MSNKTNNNRIINVSNRLPVRVDGDNLVKSSGGLVSALEGIQGDFDLQWIGWPGGAVEQTGKTDELVKRLKSEFGYYPVFLSEEEIEKRLKENQSYVIRLKVPLKGEVVFDDKIKGTITSPEGFKASAISCGIKKSRRDDLALLYSEVPCLCAATFTTNKMKSGSVASALAISTRRLSPPDKDCPKLSLRC